MSRRQTDRPTARSAGRRRPVAAQTPAAGTDGLPPGGSVRALAGAAALTLLLSLPLFAPWSFWPLAYVAFAPWLMAITVTPRAGRVYVFSAVLGAAFFLVHFRWLYSTTPEGYVAASLLLLAPGFVLGTWLIRHLRRRRGVPLVLSFPLVWVAVEFLRARMPLGFPWFLLGHTQIRLPAMIQIADLTGVYGVSFVVAMVNGLLAELILRRTGRRAGGIAAGATPAWTALVVGTVAAVHLYGWYRLAQTDARPGPRIAVLQGDFELHPRPVPGKPPATDEQKRELYFELFRQAAAGAPDLVVFPETPWSMVLNREIREIHRNAALLESMSRERARQALLMGLAGQRHHERLRDLSARHRTAIVIGSLSEEPQPDGVYPPEHRYNSAFVYRPDHEEPRRYDKIHLVPFGEAIPFRYSRRLFWLYRFLNDGPWNPWGGKDFEHTLTAGTGFCTFEIPAPSLNGHDYRFGVTICYEDVIPEVFRRFVVEGSGPKRVDFMLNISNDGWFGHGSQQAQHLVNCAFRAIENRVGIARAVNTGVSGFIDSTGRWHDLVVEPGRGPHAGGTGQRTARVAVDPRVTLYSRYGDVLAWLCGLVAAAAGLDAVTLRWRQRRAPTAAPEDPRAGGPS